MDQIPVQFKWSRALADASPACKSYLHPNETSSTRTWVVGGHLPFNKNVWGPGYCSIWTCHCNRFPKHKNIMQWSTARPNPVWRSVQNIACSIQFTVYMFDSFEMPNNLQRHNTEQVCRSVWAGHKKGGYSIGICEGRTAKQQLQLPTLCLLRFVSEEYTVSVVTLAKTQTNLPGRNWTWTQIQMAPVCLCRHTKPPPSYCSCLSWALIM